MNRGSCSDRASDVDFSFCCPHHHPYLRARSSRTIDHGSECLLVVCVCECRCVCRAVQPMLRILSHHDDDTIRLLVLAPPVPLSQSIAHPPVPPMPPPEYTHAHTHTPGSAAAALPLLPLSPCHSVRAGSGQAHERLDKVVDHQLDRHDHAHVQQPGALWSSLLSVCVCVRLGLVSRAESSVGLWFDELAYRRSLALFIPPQRQSAATDRALEEAPQPEVFHRVAHGGQHGLGAPVLVHARQNHVTRLRRQRGEHRLHRYQG